MKKPLRGATLALLAISPFAYLACSDDSAGGGGSISLSTVDASTNPVADAAPAIDAGTVTHVDAGPTTASVLVVTANKLPEPGVQVVFHDASGAVLGTETTDATGIATHPMPAGGSVTAVFGNATASNLVTILGAQPGDALTTLDPARIGNVAFAVTPPAGAAPTGTANLVVRFGTCSFYFPSTGGAADLVVTYCDNPSDVTTVVLVAVNGNGAPLASTALTGVTFAAQTALSFVDPWVPTTMTDTVTVTGVPANGAVADSNPQVNLAVSTCAGTDSITTYRFENNPANLAGGTFTEGVNRLLPTAAFAQNEIDFYESPSGGLALRALVTRGALAATRTVDFGTPLPVITSSTIAGGAAPAVTFTSASTLAGTKGIETYFTWSNDNTGGNWLVYAPPTTTTIAPPALPAALATFAPNAQSVFGDAPFVAAIDATFLPSYATVRASASALAPGKGFREGHGNAVASALPVVGTLKITAFSRNSID